MTVGSNIKFARKFYKLTQKELADKIGKNLSTIKKYEADQINIPYQVLYDISNVFDMDVETLVGNKDSLETYLILIKEQKGIPTEVLLRNRPNLYVGSEGLTDDTINLINSMFKKSDAKSNLNQLITFVNNNKPVELTEMQQETLFNEIIDYIRYKLYSIGK